MIEQLQRWLGTNVQEALALDGAQGEPFRTVHRAGPGGFRLIGTAQLPGVIRRHGEAGIALQRRLQFDGLNAMVMPVRVLEPA